MVMMVYPRTIFALSRDAGLPLLSRVAANGSPQWALATFAVGGAALALVGIYETVLAFSAPLVGAVAIAVNVAAIRLRYKEPELERPWRMPLFPLPAVVAPLVNAGLFVAFVAEDPRLAAIGFGILAVLTVVVLFAIRRARRPG